MDINSWLTVITVFIAILAFFPKEERILLQYKLNKFEPTLIITALGVFIPYLILFPTLANRIKFFNRFTIEHGFAPANIAFGVFYTLFAWLLLRLFLISPKKEVNERTINYFLRLLNELPFNRFFSLFTKYTPKDIPKKDWKLYAPIFLNPVFLKGIVQFKSEYLFNIWNKYNNEIDFRKLFNLFISDNNSAYYTEIKLHTDSDEVLANAPLLQTVLVKNLKQSIDNKILPLIYDAIQKILQAEKENSIYAYPHEHQFIREEEGYDLPIYYHIKFIGLMYSNAIYNKVDIGKLSTFNSHMRTLFSEMIGTMIKKLPIKHDKNGKEINYDWLINETVSIVSNWLEIFGGQHPLYPEEYDDSGVLKFGHVYFDSHSTYLYFIPQCLSNCFKKLCQGVDEGKISQSSLNSTFHYDIMTDYYRWYALDEIRTQIEEEILAEIPKKFLPDLLDFSLDEEFANDYPSFRQKEFRGANDKEIKVQSRLWDFLNRKGLLT